MRSLTTVALLAGPIVAASYGAASVASRPTRNGESRRPTDLLTEGFVAMAAATLAWYVIRQVSPGGQRRFSAVALYDDQVLAAWHSVALWTGLAAVVGTVAPFNRRFAGTDGLAAALGLLTIYAPVLAFVGVAGFAIGLLTGRSASEARPFGIAPLLPAGWLVWVLNLHNGWGVNFGAETTIWIMCLSAALAVRWWSDQSPATA